MWCSVVMHLAVKVRQAKKKKKKDAFSLRLEY